MSSEYESHRSRQTREAKAGHDKWVASLTPDQRANLKRLGVLVPSDDSTEVGGHAPGQTGDLAESPLARVECDFADIIDGQAGPLADMFNVPLTAAKLILEWHLRGVEDALRTHEADLLSVVVGGLLASNNVRIACAGLAFASGMDAGNNLGSQANYARKLGVSRTILSKSVKNWQRDLKLHTSVHQKSEDACATYSEVTKAKHWRRAKVSPKELLRRLQILRKESS